MPCFHRIRARLLFGFLILASVPLMAQTDSPRVRSISQKMKCDCGCGDVLAECAHRECTRRPKLKQEIVDGVLYGETDEQILQHMAAAHGTAVLVTPTFQGFDALLWIVPILCAVLALAVMGYRFRRVKHR